MDLSSLLSTVISSDSVSAISKTSGAKPSQVSDLLSKAIPVLVKGMQQNASTEQGASSLASALAQHAGSNISNLGSYLGGIDLKDGSKIIGHILGGSSGQVQSGLAQKTGLTSSQVGSILSSVAPLLLSLIGKKQSTSGGGIGSLLGSLLGSQSGGGLNDVLSSALADKDGDGKPDVLGKLGGLLGL